MSTTFLVLLALTFLSIVLRQALRARFDRLDTSRPEEQAVLERATRLSRSDLAAARQLLDEYYIKDGKREDAERAELRERARTDVAAAEELQRRLADDLTVWKAMLKDSRKKAAKDPVAQKAVANIEQWDREARAELEQLGNHLRQLKA